MHEENIPGGREGDCRPDGQFVANTWADSSMLIASCAVPLPPMLLRFPRLTPAGPVKVAGAGQHGDPVLEWDGREWRFLGQANGTSPVIYDRDGALHWIAPGPGASSQGYQYLDHDNRPVLGDLVYTGEFGGMKMHQYSVAGPRTGSLIIGQGPDGIEGCHIWTGTTRYELDTGTIRWIRAHYEEATGVWAVAYSRWAPFNDVRCRWVTVDDVLQLPVVEPLVPDPLADTDLDRRILATLERIRPRFPQPLPTDEEARRRTLGAILNAAAWEHRDEGVGLETKPNNPNSSIQPGTNIWCGTDILQTNENGVCCGRDFLRSTGAGEDAAPVLGHKGFAERSRFVVPVPHSTDPDWRMLREEVAAFKARLDDHNASVQSMRDKLAALSARIPAD